MVSSHWSRVNYNSFLVVTKIAHFLKLLFVALWDRDRSVTAIWVDVLWRLQPLKNAHAITLHTWFVTYKRFQASQHQTWALCSEGKPTFEQFSGFSFQEKCFKSHQFWTLPFTVLSQKIVDLNILLVTSMANGFTDWVFCAIMNFAQLWLMTITLVKNLPFFPYLKPSFARQNLYWDTFAF